MTETIAATSSVATIAPPLPPALSFGELLQWSDETFRQWEQLLTAHPEALDLPCDIYRATRDVRGFLVHVVAVELRYAERLVAEPVTPYEQVGGDSVSAIFSVHKRTAEKLRSLLAGEMVGSWGDMLEFPTLTAGKIRASRRKLFVHAAMHGIRHFAQLATLVRQHGIKPDWGMDFLASSAMD